MSYFKIIVGESTINYTLNPSGETTGNFAAGGAATVTRSTTYQKYGLYSYRVQTNGDDQGIEITLSALSNAIHYVTLLMRGTRPPEWDWSLDDATYTAPTLIEQIDSNWGLYGLQFPAAQANGSTTLYIDQNGAGAGDFYIDGIQVEAKEYWTTYCDGTQDGCEWLGTANASTSQRSAASRAGGRLYDLEDDYYFNIGGIVGGGAPPQRIGVDSYAILPGGELNSIKTNSRVFTLTGVINGTSDADFHDKATNLLAVLKGDNYPNKQPVTLRYTGSTIHKEIKLHYESGLEGDLESSIPCWEKVAVRFTAPDPYWYEIGESAAALDTEDSATFNGVAARLRSNGQWSNLGPPTAPSVLNSMDDFAEDETYIYIAGNFENFDGIADADYIVRYNKQTGVFSALGTPPWSGVVHKLLILANGDLLIAGNALYTWDGSSWTDLGTVSGEVEDAIQLPTGDLVLVGSFTDIDSVAVTRVARYDWTTYHAYGTGANAIAYAVEQYPGQSTWFYMAGNFTTANGVTVNYITYWNGTTFVSMGGGVDDVIRDLALYQNGDLALVGDFLNSTAGDSITRAAIWNGTSYTAMGSGLNGEGRRVRVGPDGTTYISGSFTTAGGIDIANVFAIWNNYAYAHIDFYLPGTTEYALFTSQHADPVIPQIYDVYIGTTIGTGYYGGKVTIDNDSTIPITPKIIYSRAGGTSATLATLRNEGTGKQILFNYDLLDGETLTIDLEPTKRTIISSFSGSTPSAALPNSDIGTFTLLPDSNIITSFIINDGATITAWMQWRDRFDSY